MKTKLSDCLPPLLLGALYLGAVSAHATVQQLDKVVAIVDNDVIMQSQLDQRVKEVRQTIAKRGNGSVQPNSVLDPQVLEHLIVENLQLQIGGRSSVRISDEELSQAVDNIVQRNNMSIDQFRTTLAHDGLSYEDARDQIRRAMIISRVRQHSVAERIQVSEQEVRNFLASSTGKIQLSKELHLANILISTPDSANAEQLDAATAKTRAVYDRLKAGADFAQTAIAVSGSDNALDGGDMGWRKAAQLQPPFDRELSAMQPNEITQPVLTPNGFIILKLLDKRGGETSLKDEVHVRHILVRPNEIRTGAQTKKLAQRIYDRIEVGEDFAALAKSFSEDPGSALNGGDLNWIDPKALVPEFQDTMAQTPQGILSKPFKTQYGWHVLEVLGRRATDNTIQAREQQALAVLRNRKYDEELQTWLRQIRDEAYVDIKLPGAKKKSSGQAAQ